MSELWALTASAGELESAARDRLAREIEQWLEAGRGGVALTTCHRVELYGIDVAPTLRAPRFRTGAPQAVPDAVRSRLNGSFLGIDDLYRTSGPRPGAYIKDAEALVERNTADYVAWLGRAR